LRQFGNRAHGAFYEFTTTVRALATKQLVNTLRTEGAFEGTNPRVLCLRRQVHVTAFTIGSEFEHRYFLVQPGAHPRNSSVTQGRKPHKQYRNQVES
jgi:hypothetical protein